jgi:phage-related protein (TIGR01555 family)
MLEELGQWVRDRIGARVGAVDASQALPPVPSQSPGVTAGLVDLVRARLPVLDQLINFASGIGTPADKRAYTDYAPVRQLNQISLDNMYQTSWAAGKIVNIPADDSTREWVTPSWEGYDEDQGGRDALTVAESVHGVRQKMNRGLKWSRLYGGSGIVVGIKGQEDLSKPLVLDSIKKGSLLFLHVLDRYRLTSMGIIDEDPASPNLGMPITYQIASTWKGAPIVHWTRVIRFDGYELPYYAFLRNGWWHASELQRVLENVKDYDHVRAGIMGMMNETNVDIQLVKGLGELLATNGGTAIAKQRFQDAAMLKSITNTVVMDAEDKFQQKTISFANIPDLWRTAMLDISGAADIPATRFFAQSPAGLSATGESDLTNYYDRVHADQNTRLRPQFDRLFQILMRSVFGQMPKNFTFEFNPLWQMTAVEKSTVGLNNANARKIYHDLGAIDVSLIARQLHFEDAMPAMTADDLQLAEEMAELKRSQPLPGEEPLPPDDGTDPAQPAGGAKKKAAAGEPGSQEHPDEET